MTIDLDHPMCSNHGIGGDVEARVVVARDTQMRTRNGWNIYLQTNLKKCLVMWVNIPYTEHMGKRRALHQAKKGMVRPLSRVENTECDANTAVLMNFIC